MTHESTTEPAAGGATWESGRASERLADALASGDPERIRAAGSDLAASAGTAAASSMASIAAPLLRGMEELRAGLRKRDRLEDTRYRQDLDRWTEFRSHMDARFDGFGAELDAFKAESRAQHAESATHRTQLTVAVASLVESVESLAAELIEVRRRSLADAVDPAERLRLIVWLRDHMPDLQQLLDAAAGDDE